MPWFLRILLLVVCGSIWLENTRADEPKKRVLLLASGPDGHPANTHEYVLGLKLLKAYLEKEPGIEAELVKADEPWREGPELLAKADGAVLFLTEGAKWLSNHPERLAGFQNLARRKGGLSVLHWGMGTREAKPIEPFVELFGSCHGGPDRKYKFLQTKVTPSEQPHPILRGLKPFEVRDEFYYRLKLPREKADVQPLLRAEIDGQAQIVSWAWARPDDGRSFGFSGLHFHENWLLPEYRRLVTQGVLWTLQREIPTAGIALPE